MVRSASFSASSYPAFLTFLTFLTFLSLLAFRETHPHVTVPGVHVDDFTGDS
jgi:hypothetical protein